MGRLSASLLAFALGLLAAGTLAACGSGGANLLPGKTASEINSNLDQVAQLAGEGNCVGAEGAAQQVSAQVEGLGGVDKRLKQALSEGASRLNEVVASCEEPSQEVETVEPEEEAEAVGKHEKPEKHKPEKAEKPGKGEAEEEQAETTPSLPPQANGKGKGIENGEGPPSENGGGPPSGGVGPGVPAGGD
jgi:septal ring-binding cell division protein DamX